MVIREQFLCDISLCSAHLESGRAMPITTFSYSGLPWRVNVSVIHVSERDFLVSDLLKFYFQDVPCSKTSGATTLITRENLEKRDRGLMANAKRLVYNVWILVDRLSVG